MGTAGAMNTSIAFGTGFSFLLGVLWSCAVACPWNWLQSDNAVVSFKVNLWNVHTYPGIGLQAVNAVSTFVGGDGKADPFTEAIYDFIDGKMQISDAKYHFCTLDIFDWCGMWEQAWQATWIMSVLGIASAVLFVLGGCSLYYYAAMHATETGRCISKTCLILAPLCGLVGIIGFTVLTKDFGKMSTIPMLSAGSHSAFGTGFIVAASVTALSWVPAYILYAFCRAADNEKERGVDDKDDLKGDVKMLLEQGGGTPYGAVGVNAQPQAAPHSTGVHAQPQAGPQSMGFNAQPQGDPRSMEASGFGIGVTGPQSGYQPQSGMQASPQPGGFGLPLTGTYGSAPGPNLQSGFQTAPQPGGFGLPPTGAYGSPPGPNPQPGFQAGPSPAGACRSCGNTGMDFRGQPCACSHGGAAVAPLANSAPGYLAPAW